MPKTKPSNPSIEKAGSHERSAMISTDLSEENQPSSITAADQALSAIDNDLAELEALFSGPGASSESEAPERRSAGVPESSARSKENADPEPKRRIARQEAPGSTGTPAPSGADAEDEDVYQALAELDADSLESVDEHRESLIRKKSASGDAGDPLSDHADRNQEEIRRITDVPALARRIFARGFQVVLTVLDRPFTRLPIDVKVMLGYVAWATLLVSASTWIYVLWLA